MFKSYVASNVLESVGFLGHVGMKVIASILDDGRFAELRIAVQIPISRASSDAAIAYETTIAADLVLHQVRNSGEREDQPGVGLRCSEYFSRTW